MEEQIGIYNKYIDKRLSIRQIIFILIVIGIIVITTENVIKGKIDGLFAFAGFTLSTLLGIGLSRIFKIFWHNEKEKVMAKLDTFGIILLVLYMIIEIGRKWFFQHWLTGAELNAFGLIILGGLLFGRFLGIGRRINKILTEEKKMN